MSHPAATGSRAWRRYKEALPQLPAGGNGNHPGTHQYGVRCPGFISIKDFPEPARVGECLSHRPIPIHVQDSPMSVSLLATARAIAAGGRPWRACQFLCAALLHFSTWRRWRRALEGELRVLPEGLRFALKQRVFRPYVRRRFGPSRRAAMIELHYRQLLARRPQDFVDFLAYPGACVARLIGKSGKGYSVQMALNRSKEGEVDLFLWEDDTRAGLALLAGVLGEEAGTLVFYVGGLRGVKPPLGKPEIVAATRDLHGLRPKAAILHACCHVAAALGAGRLVLPSLRNHVSQLTGLESRVIHADYDSFWLECGATQRVDGDYELSVDLPRRDPGSVKSNKRAEWLRRQALLDSMAQQIAERLGPA